MDPETVNDHYCDDLPTAPLPENKKILITGASGYAARRLIPELVSRGYCVRRLLRKKYAQLQLSTYCDPGCYQISCRGFGSGKSDFKSFSHRRQGYFYLFMGKYLLIAPLEISREGFQTDVEILL